MRTAVLVGSRRGQRQAARALGVRTVLLAERPPPPSVAARAPWTQVDFDAPVEVVIAALRRSGGDIAAVLPGSERAVVAAAAIREALGVPGCDLATAFRCHDKLPMKAAVRAAGLRCADHLAVETDTDADALIEALGLPLVVKPRASSGGRGARLCRGRDEVRQAIGPGMLAERFVVGVEMSVESFVVAGAPRFVNFTEYLVPGWANIVPAAVPVRLAEEVAELNRRAIAALGIDRGITHLELFVTRDGPVFSELALRPPGGYLMDLMARAYEFDPWRALFEVELGDRPTLPAAVVRHAGVWVLHPGAGVVRAVRGLDRARGVPGVEAALCRVSAGDRVATREGVGADVGRIIAGGASRDEVARSLRRAHRALAIEMEPPSAGAFR